MQQYSIWSITCENHGFNWFLRISWRQHGDIFSILVKITANFLQNQLQITIKWLNFVWWNSVHVKQNTNGILQFTKHTPQSAAQCSRKPKHRLYFPWTQQRRAFHCLCLLQPLSKARLNFGTAIQSAVWAFAANSTLIASQYVCV